MKENELEDVPKKKNIAFKAFIESDDSDEEEDENVAIITHKFKKFLREESLKRNGLGVQM